MEADKRLHLRGWSIVRKAQVITALIGALLTSSILVIAFYPEGNLNTSHGHPPAIGEKAALAILIALPTILMCKLIGWESLLAVNPGTTSWAIALCFVVIINSFLFFLAGTVIGWFINRRRV